jgi:hypothetical protein
MNDDDPTDESEEPTTDEDPAQEPADPTQEVPPATVAPEHKAHSGLGGILHQLAEARGIDIDGLAHTAGISDDQVDTAIEEVVERVPGATVFERIVVQFTGKKDA